MDFDLKTAFTYMAKDKSYIQKLLTGYVISLMLILVLIFPVAFMISTKNIEQSIIFFIMSILISLVLIVALTGYIYNTAHTRIKDTTANLPEWSDFGSHLLVGIKMHIGAALYFLPVLISSVAGAALILVIDIITSAQGDDSITTLLMFYLINGICTIIYFITMFFAPIVITNFSKDLNITSFLNLKKAWTSLKNNLSLYVIFIILVIATQIITQLAATILCFTIIGILLVPLIVFYTGLVFAELTAQFARSSK